MSNLLSVKLFIRDVSKRGIKNFPIRGKYQSGAQANLSLTVEKLTDEKGYVTLSLLPNARYDISVMTTKGVFEHNATINTNVAAQKPFVIIGLTNPIDSYISIRELRIVDLEDKPVANCKYKMVYLGKTIYQTVGVDGKKKIKSLVGEPVTITVLKPDNSEVATATFTYTSHKVNGGSFRLQIPIHQHQPTTAPNDPTSNPPSLTPPTNGITVVQLKRIFTAATLDHLQKVVDEINLNLEKYKLDTSYRKANFFGQIRRETGPTMLGRSEDLGHYSVHTLTTLLGYYINHPSEAHIDHGHAETIANKAYGPNAAKGIELGNINEGDGWLFRGRGMKQLTGRFNYHGFTESYSHLWDDGADFEAHPELLETMPYELRSAIWFWLTKTNHHHQHCYELADGGASASVVDSITYIVNHGELGHAGAIERRTNVAFANGVFA
jgi:predicted chitinase